MNRIKNWCKIINLAAYHWCLIAWFLMVANVCAFEEVGGNPVAMGVNFDKKYGLYMYVVNTSDGVYSFSSNVRAVCSTQFLDFPTAAAIQFSEEQAWVSIAAASSQADPPNQDLGKMDMIAMKELETIRIPIRVDKAIDMATVRMPLHDLPSSFRIKIPVKFSHGGNVCHLTVVSGWYSCEEVMMKIKKLR